MAAALAAIPDETLEAAEAAADVLAETLEETYHQSRMDTRQSVIYTIDAITRVELTQKMRMIEEL